MQLSFIYVEYLKNYYYILCFFIKKNRCKEYYKGVYILFLKSHFICSMLYKKHKYYMKHFL